MTLPAACSLVQIEVTGKPPDPRAASGMRNEILNDVAHALALLAPIYVADAASGMPREIPGHVLVGARFKGGAQVLVMRDGTQYRGLTIQRAEMEAALQILKGSGFGRRWDSPTEPGAKPMLADSPAAATDFDDLLSRLKEIEDLVQFPTGVGHLEKANELAISIARSAPGPIPHFAMLLASAASGLRQSPTERYAHDGVQESISQLQRAIEQAKNPSGPSRP